jgi:hypothetical protein
MYLCILLYRSFILLSYQLQCIHAQDEMSVTGMVHVEPLLDFSLCLIHQFPITILLLVVDFPSRYKVTFTMPTSPRTNSPIVPTFPCRLSEPITPLACIVEIPKHPHLNSPRITSPRPSKPDEHYTFLDSSSNTATSSSTSSLKASPPLPHEKFPSCLSLANLGYEDDDNDWTTGWEILEPDDAEDRNVRMRQLHPSSLLKIHKGDFSYIPSVAKVESHWSDDVSGDSIKLTRRRLARRKQNLGGRKKVKLWLRFLLRKVKFGGRQ